MQKITIPLLTILCSSSFALAQRSSPPSEAELLTITERGRQLAEYDIAALHATDAVRAMKPPDGLVEGYIANKSDGHWTVMFGRLNESRDKFLVAYEASQQKDPNEFDVTKNEPPKEGVGYCLTAARAIDTVQKDFRGEKRPYNVAVLPAASDQVFVYVYPAQTKKGIYPLGGDARFLVTSNGATIIEKRQLHKSIIEFTAQVNSEEVEAGFHTSVLDDIPEDTDVYHVLSRKPSVPHFVVTKQYVYRIETDGSIKYLMTTEAFEKTKDK